MGPTGHRAAWADLKDDLDPAKADGMVRVMVLTALNHSEADRMVSSHLKAASTVLNPGKADRMDGLVPSMAVDRTAYWAVPERSQSSRQASLPPGTGQSLCVQSALLPPDIAGTTIATILVGICPYSRNILLRQFNFQTPRAPRSPSTSPCPASASRQTAYSATSTFPPPHDTPTPPSDQRSPHRQSCPRPASRAL
jgi:hypothetical protein